MQLTTHKMTQLEQVRRHLSSGWSITPIDALRSYGCFRLAAIIHVLRHEYGMTIKTIPTTDKKTGKVFATYKLDQVIQIENKSDSPTQTNNDEQQSLYPTGD